MWEMQYRARGFQVTKCHPSVVRSMFRHFASCFRESPPVQCAVGVSFTKPVMWDLGSAMQWVFIPLSPAMGPRQCFTVGVR